MSDTDVIEIAGIKKQFKINSAENGGYLNALNEVSLTINRGSAVAIVGKNGCGKSTLLKVIAGIVKPSAGTVTLKGQVSSILDIGAGFVPELTGRENIFLVGRLHGLRKQQIEALVPHIMEFSEIGDFIDTPVKNYSQGMFLRLAFSITVNLPIDVLLIDEVFAVGDFAFRAKCFDKINQLHRNGLTLVIVTHNFSEVAGLCNRCVVLSAGKVIADGSPEDVYDTYISSIESPNPQLSLGVDIADLSSYFKVHYPGFVDITGVQITPTNVPNTVKSFSISDEISVSIHWNKLQKDCSVCFHIDICDDMDKVIVNSSNTFNKTTGEVEKMNYGNAGHYTDSCLLPAGFLNAGSYKLKLSVTIYQTITDYFCAIESIKPFLLKIENEQRGNEKRFWTYSPAPIRTPLTWLSVSV